MKIMAILSFVLSLGPGCSSNSPMDVAVPFEPGTWVGSFSYNANYGTEGTVAQSGDVTFSFTASSYTYKANVKALTNRTRWRCWGPGIMLRDHGNLMKYDRVVNMDDISSLRVIDVPQRSLYLHGRYSYSAFGKSMSFSKQENGGSLTVTLTKQD